MPIFYLYAALRMQNSVKMFRFLIFDILGQKKKKEEGVYMLVCDFCICVYIYSNIHLDKLQVLDKNTKHD